MKIIKITKEVKVLIVLSVLSTGVETKRKKKYCHIGYSQIINNVSLLHIGKFTNSYIFS